MTKVRTITLRCKTPPGVSDDEIADFITDWLETGGGCRHPDDPLFDSLSVYSVKIRNKLYVNPDPKQLTGGEETSQ